MIDILLLGAGGHAKSVIDVMRASGQYRPIGCVGQAPGGIEHVLGVPVLGDDDRLAALRHQGVAHAFVAIGDNARRAELMSRARALGFHLANVVAPNASVSPTARLGRGIAILSGAHVGPDTSLEDGVILNTRAIVDHDGHLESCAHVGPGAALAGKVRLEAQAFVATGASVIPQRTIGARAIVGAGAVVIRDIPADVIAFGNPARPYRTLLAAPENRSRAGAAIIRRAC